METSVNNKCKAFTSLEQSKKLAEILPLESADMYYGYGKDKPKFLPISDADIKCLSQPCWSLAALLGVLPYPSLHKTFSGWRCDSYDKEGKTCKIGENADNPIDACYELILKLNKLKML